MNEILKKLSEPLRLSEVGVIVDWKTVKKVKAGKYKAVLLVHKTSRTVYSRFNDACGLGWQDEYEREGANLVCTISVYDPDKDRWIKRKGVGVPSTKDRVKGEYSDALKRASTAFGLGIELYNMPKMVIELDEDEVIDEGGGKISLSPFLDTKIWKVVYELEDGKVKNLTITDGKGKVRWPN